MRVVDALASVDLSGPCVSIGNFDGVHLGHRALLARMREVSQAEGLPSLIVSFFPPARVVFGGATFLSSEEEKLELLAEYRPDVVALLAFDHAFAQTPPGEFVAALARLAPHSLIVGEDFRFGKDRAGGLAELRAAAPSLVAFGLVEHGGEVVKSSMVREHLAAGRIERANALLGRPYLARGTVTRGQQRGRTIGYPTANVRVDPLKALPLGVFAVTVAVAGRSLRGMANVGSRPSFEEEPPALEVHLFDFTGDLYDEELTVTFHSFLRSQRKFSGLEELKSQLDLDEAASRQALREPHDAPLDGLPHGTAREPDW